MNGLLERLAAGEILVCDGAMGTMLQASGYLPGDSPEKWSLEHEDVLRGIHQAYIDAGASIILSNTFGANKPKMAKYGLGDQTESMNTQMATLLKETAAAADRPILVAGDIGPTGEFMQPLGTISEADMIGMVAEQVRGLLAAQVELIFVETMMDLGEMLAAVKAAKAITDLPVMASMAYNVGKQGFRTMMGNSPTQVTEALLAEGVEVIGANCGNVLASAMPDLVSEIKAAGARYVVIEPNAGIPEIVDGETVFSQEPDEMAASVPAIIKAGANIIGGCCGTTPAHIRAIADAICG